MNDSPEFVTLEVEGKTVRLPVVVGSEGERRSTSPAPP